MTFSENLRIGYDLGFSFVALNGKVPVQSGWTTSPRMTLDDALAHATTGNIGVRCGKASAPDGKYLLVVDQDTEIGIDLPLTMMVKTKSGYHHYYYTDQPLGNSAGKLAPKYDTRGEGGQVVFAGSRHPGNGHIYDWHTTPETPIAELPASLVRKLVSRKPRHAPAAPTHYLAGSKLANAIVKSECERITGSGAGERNNALNTAAFKIGKHVAAGIIDQSYAVQELTNAAISMGQTRSETHATIKSGMAGGALTPRRNAPAEPEATPEEVFAEPPVELSEPKAALDFPVHVFPIWLAEMIQAVAIETETPEPMAASVAIGVLGTVAQKQYCVNIKGNYTESLSVWPCVAMDSGERKSSVMGMMSKPIKDYDQGERKRLKSEIDRNRSLNKSLDKKIDKIRTAQASKDGPAWRNDQDIIDNLETQKKTELEYPSYWCQDITPEALAELLGNNQERMGMFSDEGGIFKTMAGRYNQNIANIDLMLQSYTGTEIKINRKSSEPLCLDKPAVTLCLCLQPKILREIAENQVFSECGLLARILFCLPDSMVGERTCMTDAAPASVVESYQHEVDHRIRVELPETPRVLKLTEDARSLWLAYFATIEPQLKKGEALDGMHDWPKKLLGTVARIAGLLHVAEHRTPEDHPINDFTMDRAIQLGQYYLNQAIITFGMMDKDSDTVLAEYILDWIRKQCVEEFAWRDCQRAMRSRIKDADRLRMLLDKLQDYGHIMKMEVPNKRGKSTILYQVHPEL